MLTLLQLLLRNGGFVVFVLIQALCFYVIVQYNERQNAIWSHSSGLFADDMLQKRQELTDYMSLSQRIDSMAKENARLQEQLANLRMVQVPYRDTFFMVNYDSIAGIDSIKRKVVRPQFQFITARVVNNNVSGNNNWIMLNRGRNDGIEPNLAVVSAQGIVGIVRHVDDDFSMAMSILHQQTKISAALPQHQNAFGSLIWEGKDPSIMTLKFIPKHFQVKVGDNVMTSGLSLMFPKGIVIGKVDAAPEPDAENPYFTTIKVRLNQNMTTVNDVMVVNNLMRSKVDSLQQRTNNEQ
jgi:rod shape-determining protein MreC